MTTLYQHQEDKQLVRQTLEGSKGSFDELSERYFGSIYAIAYFRMKNREVAEDLAQEVLLRSFLFLKNLKDYDKYGAWVHQMARNLAVDWQRREISSSKLMTLVPENQMENIEPKENNPNPREQLQQKQDDELIQSVLNRLSTEEKELIEMHYVQEFSHREIGRKLGVHHTTVGDKLRKALKVLRTQVEDNFGETSHPLTPRKEAKLTALSAVGTVSALSPGAKSVLYSFAESSQATLSTLTQQTTATAVNQGTLGSISSWFIKGGIAMSLGKIGTAVVAGVGVVAGFYFYSEENKTPQASRTTQVSLPGVSGEREVITGYQLGEDRQFKVPPGKTVDFMVPENLDQIKVERFRGIDNQHVEITSWNKNGQMSSRVIVGTLPKDAPSPHGADYQGDFLYTYSDNSDSKKWGHYALLIEEGEGGPIITCYGNESKSMYKITQEGFPGYFSGKMTYDEVMASFHDGLTDSNMLPQNEKLRNRIIENVNNWITR